MQIELYDKKPGKVRTVRIAIIDPDTEGEYDQLIYYDEQTKGDSALWVKNDRFEAVQ